MYLTAKLVRIPLFQNIALGDLHELVFQLFIENQPPTLVRHRAGDGHADSALAGMSVGSVSMLVSGAGAFMMVFSNSRFFLYFSSAIFLFFRRCLISSFSRAAVFRQR
jgi:hypothetical protein